MENDLSKSIGLGIVVTLITNIGGVSTGRSAIIGATVMLIVRTYIYVNTWVTTVNKKLESVSSASQTTSTANSTASSSQTVHVTFPVASPDNTTLTKLVNNESNQIQPTSQPDVNNEEIN